MAEADKPSVATTRPTADATAEASASVRPGRLRTDASTSSARSMNLKLEPGAITGLLATALILILRPCHLQRARHGAVVASCQLPRQPRHGSRLPPSHLTQRMPAITTPRRIPRLDRDCPSVRLPTGSELSQPLRGRWPRAALRRLTDCAQAQTHDWSARPDLVRPRLLDDARGRLHRDKVTPSPRWPTQSDWSSDGTAETQMQMLSRGDRRVPSASAPPNRSRRPALSRKWAYRTPP